MANLAANGRKYFQCDVCKKTFNQKQNLEKHINNVHEVIKDYNCSFCMKRFSRHEHLQKHVKYMHSKMKKIQCVICNDRFELIAIKYDLL